MLRKLILSLHFTKAGNPGNTGILYLWMLEEHNSLLLSSHFMLNKIILQCDWINQASL